MQAAIAEMDSAMVEYPLLLQDRLVSATLREDEPKTQTRRAGADAKKFLKLKAGNILWVREAWHQHPDGQCCYREQGCRGPEKLAAWKPNLHMPRTACRIRLRLTLPPFEEPIQLISETDARAEGVPRRTFPADGFLMEHDEWQDANGFWHMTARSAFQQNWDSIYREKGHGWATNTKAVVMIFRRVKP